MKEKGKALPSGGAKPGTTAGALATDNKVGHILEDPGGIAHLIGVEVPTEYYYEAYGKDLLARHPKASPDVHEHMRSLAVFLDTSILSGFSYGSAKAFTGVTEGKVLGRVVNRKGSTCEPERLQAIVDFAPLENPNHIRQFLGCTNWIRWFLPAWYPVAARTLTEFLKPGKDIPRNGFGFKGGTTDGDKAVLSS